jgi:hypothetical protein
MILNGLDAAADAGRVEITLTKTVLHRAGPKPAGSDGSCASDCRWIIR